MLIRLSRIDRDALRDVLRVVALDGSEATNPRPLGWPQNAKSPAMRSTQSAHVENGGGSLACGRNRASSSGTPEDKSPAGRGMRMKSAKRGSEPCDPCIYCGSIKPPTKREHVMSQALGTFEQNWTLNCVCDECNEYFANNLELALGRDSREAIFRLELGLKSVAGASQLLNRRVKTTLRDPGQFHGVRVLMMPSDDGTNLVPAPVPQVGFRRDGEDWHFLIEKELTPENAQEFKQSSVEIRILGVGPDCDRLKQRLAALGIGFVESTRAMDQPITGQSSLTVVYDINVDETIVRSACKIGFNYAAKVLGCVTVRRAGFEAARRFVRYGEAPVRLATVQQLSVLVGSGAESARIHACGLGWDRGYLVALVSLFNEVTYGLRLCAAEPNEFATARHFFDPLTRAISEAEIGS